MNTVSVGAAGTVRLLQVVGGSSDEEDSLQPALQHHCLDEPNSVFGNPYCFVEHLYGLLIVQSN